MDDTDHINDDSKRDEVFKKPILVGKIGRLPKKFTQPISNEASTSSEINEKDDFDLQELEPSQPKESFCIPQSTENGVSFPYKEPSWSGLPISNGKEYALDVLKNGRIIETINLMESPFWIFGRFPECHICMQHPTISRYHAVLQYRDESNDTESCGFYIYDLGSTHGTYLNKNRLKPKVYARIQVGHMLKLGCSTRSYILTGPEDDEEEESELTVTELKQKRAEQLLKREEKAREAERREQEKRKKEEERGIDWGLGEDADEETDLSENPYAQTTNEELYLDDPKKALRGFFEREGLDLQYDCSEQGLGQFLCKVELPIDDELGRALVAEVIHKGKKKEAVVQCALEACRILDRHGILRQATHESRKRKAKDWEENDFYDSDEDTFLDRTGTIEKKREKRMKAKVPEKAETYEGLLEREKNIASEILSLQQRISKIQKGNSSDNGSNDEEDSLDSYMKQLNDNKTDKQMLKKLKLELTNLKTEQVKVTRLVDIAKPSVPLVGKDIGPSTSTNIRQDRNKTFPIMPRTASSKRHLSAELATNDSLGINPYEEVEEEEEEENNSDLPVVSLEESSVVVPPPNEQNVADKEKKADGERLTENKEEDKRVRSPVGQPDRRDLLKERFVDTLNFVRNTVSREKFEKMLNDELPPLRVKYKKKIEEVTNKLKEAASNEERLTAEGKILTAKKRKLSKIFSDWEACLGDSKLEQKATFEMKRILKEINQLTLQKTKLLDEVKDVSRMIRDIMKEITEDVNRRNEELKSSRVDAEPRPSTSSVNDKCQSVNPTENHSLEESMEVEESSEADEKKKRKNQRRIHQRQERAEQERLRGYEEDATREDYNMWIPPSDQSGDGRTTLNEKLGY